MAKKSDYYRTELAKLLGLDLPVKPITIPKKQIMAIEELDVQNHREANGIGYFLAAPELFSHRECQWCGMDFLVSRRDIAYCGYEHLQLGLNRMGIKWDKNKGFEAIVHDHFKDNEPIWIRRIPDIKEILSDFEPFVPKPEIIKEFPPEIRKASLNDDPNTVSIHDIIDDVNSTFFAKTQSPLPRDDG